MAALIALINALLILVLYQDSQVVVWSKVHVMTTVSNVLQLNALIAFMDIN